MSLKRFTSVLWEGYQEGRALIQKIMEAFYFMLCLGVFLLADFTYGQEHIMFLSNHHKSIESYIMNGYGNRSSYQCDVLYDNAREDIIEGRAQFVMGLNEIEHFDLSSNLVSSQCLLVSVEVNKNESLAALVKFGWTVVQHKRVALVMKMSSGINLNMSTNITKLPFLVAAELTDGSEQFLCPVVGMPQPYLQHSMCDHEHISYKKKVVRVSIIGVPPYLYGKTHDSIISNFRKSHVVLKNNIYAGTTNGLDGADIRLLYLLSDKLNFEFNITVPTSFTDSYRLVGVSY